MSIKLRGKVWHYEFMARGIRYWGTTGEKVKSRAAQFEAMKIAEVRLGNTNPAFRKCPTLSEHAAAFLRYFTSLVEAGQRDFDTLRYYRSGWKLLSTTRLAGMRMDQIGRRDAAVLVFPGGPSNANNAFRMLSRLLNIAVDWKLLQQAPKIALLEERGREALIEAASEELLLRHAPQPLADVLVVMMDCGLRPEEAMRMRWEHIYWEREAVLVPYGKSSRARRWVPLSIRMAARLRGRQPVSAIPAAEWVFPSPRAACGHLTTVAKQWRATVAAANAECDAKQMPRLPIALDLYCARHTFLTDMSDLGVSLAALQKLAGHSDIKTTMKYLHPDTGDATATINRRNEGKGPQLVKASA